jgi:hypothetical protein
MRNFLLSLWYRYKHWRYERRCIKYFGAKPETIYVSQKDYDALVKKINNPDPEQIESLRKLMSGKSPWDEEE